MKNRIIIVDDDHVNNMMNSFFISRTLPDVDIVCFEQPYEALEFLHDSANMEDDQIRNVILLDINMPEINGWDFLDEFEKMNPEVHKRYKIYLLSSSIDPGDIARAEANVFVEEFLSKPITDTAVLKLFAA